MIIGMTYLSALVAAVAILATADSQIITDDSYFFGQSPPVYPTRMLTLFN